MIHAAISIRVKGQIYRYVRDITTDTAGVGGQYYAYRGNARQKLSLTRNNINHSRDTGLKKETSYDFRVNVNGAGVETYSISFVPRDPLQPITYFDLISKLNAVSNDFEVIFDDTNRDEEGIYFVAKGNQAGTSIVVQSGVTNDLFINLNDFDELSTPLASDNFFDQNGGAGQIASDLATLTAQLEVGNIDDDPVLLFPESTGNTGLLTRESHEVKGSLIVNQIVRKSIDGFNVVEINKTTREGHVG